MTIKLSHVMLSLMIPAGISIAGVEPQGTANQQQSTEDQASTDRAVATATIANMLPVDGCSYPVTINGTDYAPDDESRAAIEELVPAGGTITVRISYRLTGGTGQVACGFGATRQLREISFRVLRVIEQ